MDMETVAWDGILRDVEVRIDEHGPSHLGGVPLPIVSQLERFASGFLYLVGSITERDDIHFNLLPQSKLWSVEEVL